ncbi:MAG: hypothetical protein Q7S74_05270 [Nanoarchaeota archaeon]|nr:hypothetical protein [Nanoarchaeota archaeon]
MEKIYMKRLKEVQNDKKELEEKLNVSIKIIGRNVVFEGPSIDEYEATLIFEAIEFGFSVKKALQLKNEEMMFKKIHIKEHTKRNLTDILSRLIGTEGKTKRIIEDISGCFLVIKEGEVGIIGDGEAIEAATMAIINLIKGSKQSNIYRYLERSNSDKKEISRELK